MDTLGKIGGGGWGCRKNEKLIQQARFVLVSTDEQKYFLNLKTKGSRIVGQLSKITQIKKQNILTV